MDVDDADLREQIFNNTVREKVVSIFIKVVALYILGKY
jgi:hypothetical protein